MINSCWALLLLAHEHAGGRYFEWRRKLLGFHTFSGIRNLHPTQDICIGKTSDTLQMLLPLTQPLGSLLPLDFNFWWGEKKYNICKNKELTKGHFTFISDLSISVRARSPCLNKQNTDWLPILCKWNYLKSTFIKVSSTWYHSCCILWICTTHLFSLQARRLLLSLS